jgi:hypothetical protein
VALEKSVRLDPRDPRSAIRLNHKALGFYFSREYEAAVEVAKRAIRSYPDYPNTYRWLTAALGQMGSNHGSKGSAGEGHRDRTGRVRHVCQWACALDAAGRPRPHARRPAQGRLGRLTRLADA